MLALPSCPRSLAPQQRTPPVRVVAHEWSPPPPTQTASPIPLATTNDACTPASRPSPSCPIVAAPQQEIEPSLRTAHIWLRPPPIETTSLELATTMGLGLGLVLAAPVPSCPSSLAPQQ